MVFGCAGYSLIPMVYVCAFLNVFRCVYRFHMVILVDQFSLIIAGLSLLSLPGNMFGSKIRLQDRRLERRMYDIFFCAGNDCCEWS